MAKSKYEDQTVEELQDELRHRDLAVSGSKAELVKRLEAADEGEGRLGTAREAGRAKPKSRVIHAGGHAITVDVEPATPDPIDLCGVHGVPLKNGKCPEPHESQAGWEVED